MTFGIFIGKRQWNFDEKAIKQAAYRLHILYINNVIVMAGKQEANIIDLRKITQKILARKKLFYIVLPIVFVLSSIYIFSLPRYYTSTVKLAPETDNSLAEGGLGGLASSFGFDIGSMSTSDAIFPELYPELLGTNDFITKFFTATVEDEKNTFKTDYYTYLTQLQKRPWWSPVTDFFGGILKALLPSSEEEEVSSGAGGNGTGGNNTFNPLHLTKKQNDVAEAIKGKIKCSIDRKTSLITIDVTDQDRRICATIADSIRLKIQEFIIDYRTRKARVDVEYYTKLTEEAKKEYEMARETYTRFADTNRSLVLESITSMGTDLEKEMTMKYTNYTTYNGQLQAAIAKLQQRTPSFTLLQGASIPVKPVGPKRVRFVFIMMFLASIGVCAYILLKYKD